ncbi:MAG: phosphopantetheine-binding protein [Acidobacteriota bacterium]
MDSSAAQMIDFLLKNVIHDPELEIDEDTPLVSTGLVDSFALVEVLVELERVTRRRIPTGRISPQDLNTIRQMLAVVERWGQS